MTTETPEEMTGWFGGTGDSWTLRVASMPTPGPTQLLVRAEAAALNDADADLAEPGEELLAGFEVCGRVVAVGAFELDHFLGTVVLDHFLGTVVLDHVGAATFAAGVRLTRPAGQLVSVGRLAGAETTLDLTALAAAGIGVRSASHGFVDPDQIGTVLSVASSTELGPLVAQGRILPVLDQVLGSDQAPQALARLRSGEARGKIVLRVH